MSTLRSLTTGFKLPSPCFSLLSLLDVSPAWLPSPHRPIHSVYKHSELAACQALSWMLGRHRHTHTHTHPRPRQPGCVDSHVVCGTTAKEADPRTGEAEKMPSKAAWLARRQGGPQERD